MRTYLLSILFLLSTGARAQAELPMGSNAEFCQKIDEAKLEMKKQKLPNMRALRFKFLFYKLFSSKSFELSSLGEPRTSGSPVHEDRYLIVTLGVPSDDPASLESYEMVKKEMKALNGKLLKLIQEKTPARCETKARQLAFEVTEFSEKRSQLAAMEAQRRNEEHEYIQGIYDRMPGELKQRWKMKIAYHVSELRDLIAAGEIDHLMIVSHANKEGHLVDAHGNYLPLGYFQGVSGQLKSLSIFSCHGPSVMKAYQLEKDSKLRIFYPEAKSKLLNDSAILKAMPAFVKRVTKQIGPAIEKVSAAQECSLVVKAGEVSGEVAILLGDHYLIGYQRGGKLSTYPFDCSLLDSETMVSIRSLDPRKKIAMVTDWELALASPASEKSIGLLNTFESEGNYAGSLFEITLP